MTTKTTNIVEFPLDMNKIQRLESVQWRPATKEETDSAYRQLQREAVERNPFHAR